MPDTGTVAHVGADEFVVVMLLTRYEIVRI